MKPLISKLLGAMLVAILAFTPLLKAQEGNPNYGVHQTAEQNWVKGSRGKLVNYPDYTFSITPSVGALLFYGDLRVYSLYPVTNHYNEWNIGYGASVSDWVLPFLGLQANYVTGDLSGTRRDRAKNWLYNPWSIYFNGHINEFTGVAKINIVPLIKNQPGKLDVIGYIGYGVVQYQAQLKQLSTGNIEKGFGYKDDPTTNQVAKTASTYAMPLGFEINYHFSPHWSAGINIGHRVTGTDSLDSYMKKGSKNDGYGYYAFQLSYNFGHSPALFHVKEKKKHAKKEKTDEQLAKEQAEKDRLAKEQAEQAEKDRLAKEQAEKDRVAKEQAEKDRQEKERQMREKDTDGDGVPDMSDKCPQVAGTKANNGCPESKPLTAAEMKLVKSITVRYEYNKDDIRPEFYGQLDKLAELLKSHPDCNLTITGHADSEGSEPNNIKRSESRAETMKNYLVTKGVPNADRITTSGVGSSKPVSSNKSAAGRAMNRRVVFNMNCNK